MFIHHFVCSMHFPTVQKHTDTETIPHFYWKNDKGVEPSRAYAFGREMVCNQKSVRNRNFFENAGHVSSSFCQTGSAEAHTKPCKTSPQGTSIKRPVIYWDHAVSWGGGFGLALAILVGLAKKMVLRRIPIYFLSTIFHDLKPKLASLSLQMVFSSLFVETLLTVDAHRLQKRRDLLAFEKLASWRRMNGFDRVADGEENWFHGHRSLPFTPEEYAAGLWPQVNTLKDAILMPRQKVSNLINEIEQGKVSGEEFAILKRLVEKRSREAAQAQVTVTPADTVQPCSLCPLNPEMPPDVCMRLESNEGRMDPERGELEPPSAGTSLETPGHQCPPNEGTWETGRTTANGFLTAGVGSNQGGNISSPTERVDTRAGTKSTTTSANINFLQQGHKLRDEEKGSEENKQFHPGGKGEKALLWNAAVTLSSFFCEEHWAVRGSLLVLRVLFLSVLYVLFLFALFYNCCYFQLTTFQQETWIKSLMYATGGQAFSRLSTP